jgi:hypothetical protein
MRRNITSVFYAVTLAAICLAFIRPAHADWTWVDLDSSDMGGVVSQCDNTYSADQVGFFDSNSFDPSDGHAGLWSGSASGCIDLNPSHASASEATSIYQNPQTLAYQAVGWATISGNNHAGLWWSNNHQSWRDLNPAGASASQANAVYNGQQVGSAAFGGNNHAGLWTGTSNSWVDLNPAGASASTVYAVYNGQQVGAAGSNQYYDGTPYGHAGLWNGSPGSWVDLNPNGATSSIAYGVYDGQQVGAAIIGGNPHAGLWNGTFSSWVDLNPTGCTYSSAAAVCNGLQVGCAAVGTNPLIESDRAVLWNGGPASLVDLGSMLPEITNWQNLPPYPCYEESAATGVFSSSGEIWVSGWAYSSYDMAHHAILWHYTPVPEPSSLAALILGTSGLAGLAWGRRKN